MIQVQHQVQQHCNRRNKNPGKMEYGRLSKVKKNNNNKFAIVSYSRG